jgi:carboxymethylenebutenolidase
MIEYTSGDDSARGYMALPSEAKAPGVLLLHPWWGLNDFMKDLAERLAGEGYVVLVPDLFDGRVATTPDEAEQLVMSIAQDDVAPKVQGAAQYLRADERTTGSALGVVGFSYGASWALWLAENRPADVAATVLFYGSYALDFVNVRSTFLGHFAESDPHEPVESVRETEERLLAAGRSVTFHVYPGTGHWFFESDRLDAYHPSAAQLAWERTVSFLKRQLR